MRAELADYLVVGESLAGFSAALLLAESRDRVALINFHRDTDAVADLPRIQTTSLNAPTSGASFATAMNVSLGRSGVIRPTNCYVTNVHSDRRDVIVECTEQRWSCKGVVFAPNGTEPGIEITTPLHGFGVSYSAASDAPFYAGRRVAVYGDVPRVIEHAWTAARYASEVLVLLKGPTEDGDVNLLNDLRLSSAVTLEREVTLRALHTGVDGTLAAIDIESPTGHRALEIAALFVAQHVVPTNVVRGEFTDGIALAGLAYGINYWNHAKLADDGARAARTLLTVHQ
jgi:thioredoxin reductase